MISVVFLATFLLEPSCCVTWLNMWQLGHDVLGILFYLWLNPLLLISPWHQQPWYWICIVNGALSFASEEFNYGAISISHRFYRWVNARKTQQAFNMAPVCSVVQCLMTKTTPGTAMDGDYSWFSCINPLSYQGYQKLLHWKGIFQK